MLHVYVTGKPDQMEPARLYWNHLSFAGVCGRASAHLLSVIIKCLITQPIMKEVVIFISVLLHSVSVSTLCVCVCVYKLKEAQRLLGESEAKVGVPCACSLL